MNAERLVCRNRRIRGFLAAALAVAVLSGCASVPPIDVQAGDCGTAVPPATCAWLHGGAEPAPPAGQETAPVVLLAWKVQNGRNLGQLEGTLTRIDPDGSTHEASFQLPGGRPRVVALRPGLYYVSELRGQPLRFQFQPRSSLFEVKAGQLNWPGTWVFQIATKDEGFTGGTHWWGWRAELLLHHGDRDRQDVRVALQRELPALSQDLAPQLTNRSQQ